MFGGGSAARDYVPPMHHTAFRCTRRAMIRVAALATAASLALPATRAEAADIYATSFDAYGTGTLSGQLAWLGVGGSWAVSGATNAPQIPANVIGAGVDPGITPVGGVGRMVRLCSERFNAGRTKAWLDLANSGRWAAASKGGNGVLETRIKIYIPSGQALPSTFGVMISRDAVQTAGGFVVSAQTGAVSLLNNGYALANRTPTGATVPLNAWNEFVYRWTVATGEGELVVNGVPAGTHVTTLSGAVYASNLLATTDATPGTLNAFGYFDDLALAAVPATPAPCTADLNGDGARDASDIAIMLGAWGAAGGDVTGDGTTDAQDLAVLLSSWGPC
jgi:hypothetical protein